MDESTKVASAVLVKSTENWCICVCWHMCVYTHVYVCVCKMMGKLEWKSLLEGKYNEHK